MSLKILDPNSLRKIQKVVQKGETVERLITGVFGVQKKTPLANTGLNNFIGKVKNDLGLYKNTRFYVQIIKDPTSLSRGSADTLTAPGFSGLDHTFDSTTDSMFLCNRAILPGTNFTGTDNLLDFTSNGLVRRDITTEYQYQNLNLSFYLDRKLHVKKYFETWANQVISKQTHAINYYNSIVADIMVVALDENNENVLVTVFKNCYPKQIQDIELSWGDNPTPKNIDVQFTFEKIEYSHSIEKTALTADASDSSGVNTGDPTVKKLSSKGEASGLNAEVKQQLQTQRKNLLSQFNFSKGQ